MRQKTNESPEIDILTACLFAVLVGVELRRTMALFYSSLLLFADSAGYGQKQLRCSKRRCDASREGDGCAQEERGTAQVFKFRQGLGCSLFKACSRQYNAAVQERLVMGSRMTCESAAGMYVWSKRGGWAERLVTPNLQLLRLFCIVSMRINDMGQGNVPEVAATLGDNCAVNFCALSVVMDASPLPSWLWKLP
jgi:hypothetical protein